MTLCEQMARQSNAKQPTVLNSNGNFNVQQFPTVQEFPGNPQNVPLTGETSTSSSQIMFNPGTFANQIFRISIETQLYNISLIGYSFSSTPICFYPSSALPIQPYYRIQQPQYWPMHPQYVEVVKPSQVANAGNSTMISKSV